MTLDQDLLDDPARLEAADPGSMLRAVASGAAQVRESAALAAEAGVAGLAADGRPRSVLVCGMGGSAVAGDLLAAVAGAACPVPVLSHRDFGLPAWVGAADLVVAVSCSGATQETLSGLEEAVRRGSRLLVVGAADSPLEALARRGRGVFVPVAPGREPRASVWALSVPLVVAAHELRLLSAPPESVEAAAVALELAATRCRPDAGLVTNPGKSLALALAGSLPVVWGSSALAGTAAHRFACQLNENAGYPAVWGVLPEAGHNQVVVLDGPFAAGRRAAPSADFFRDRLEDEDEPPGRTPLHPVLLRDPQEHPQVARRADAVRDLARERGLDVTELAADGAGALERVASLVGPTDWASVYLALLEGTDPTPVAAVEALKSRAAR